MGTNSALICKRVIDNVFQVMSIHFIALAQAVDCLKIAGELAPVSRRVYDDVRAIIPASSRMPRSTARSRPSRRICETIR